MLSCRTGVVVVVVVFWRTKIRWDEKVLQGFRKSGEVVDGDTNGERERKKKKTRWWCMCVGVSTAPSGDIFESDYWYSVRRAAGSLISDGGGGGGGGDVHNYNNTRTRYSSKNYSTSKVTPFSFDRHDTKNDDIIIVVLYILLLSLGLFGGILCIIVELWEIETLSSSRVRPCISRKLLIFTSTTLFLH